MRVCISLRISVSEKSFVLTILSKLIRALESPVLGSFQGVFIKTQYPSYAWVPRRKKQKSGTVHETF